APQPLQQGLLRGRPALLRVHLDLAPTEMFPPIPAPAHDNWRERIARDRSPDWSASGNPGDAHPERLSPDFATACPDEFDPLWSSWPGLSWPSTSCLPRQRRDARDKPGHDGGEVVQYDRDAL